MGAVLTGQAPQPGGRAPPPVSLAWLVWSLGAVLYLIAFYQRVAPAVITQELTRDFGLSAASLGNLSAFYFYSYVAVQIPTGLLADRWGPRRVLAAGAALTALGTLLFAIAPTVAWANAGRLAIGAAAGVAFVSMLKLASHWMPFRRFAFASGVALFVGVLGATMAGAPLRILVDAFGWRTVMGASAAACAIAAVAIWIVVRDDPSERGYASYFTGTRQEARGSMASQLREVFSYRNTWLCFLIPGALSGIILTFAGLWGVPFLVSQYGFGTREAALACSAMLVAWSLASIAYGPLSQRIGQRKPLYAAGLVATLAIWSIVVFVPALPRALLLALLLAVSISAGAFILTFAFAKESVPAHLGGTVSGIANMGVMVGGMVMQPLVGLVLDQRWQGAMAGGTRVYAFADYQWGFAMMLGWGVLSLVLLAFARETYCKPL
ncbi:MAG TPA: MFS transporter [Usitatibacter sp.]|nr:MFS transporter [Usitatibacter sp.]